jgi:hypothetical protein
MQADQHHNIIFTFEQLFHLKIDASLNNFESAYKLFVNFPALSISRAEESISRLIWRFALRHANQTLKNYKIHQLSFILLIFGEKSVVTDRNKIGFELIKTDFIFYESIINYFFLTEPY